MIFDAGPGELLTVCNVANLVPPYAPDVACHGTSAALEFAVGRGELALHGAWFSIRTGALSLLQADGAFSSLESERTGSQPTPR